MWKFPRLIQLLLPPLFLGVAIWWLLPWCVSLPATLAKPLTPSLIFLARDGSQLRQLLTADGDRVLPAPEYKGLPPSLIAATMVAEDHRFGSHGGVDLLAIGRAAWDNAQAGRIVSGASTIHQQLIKVAAQRPGKRGIGVKIMEALQARRLQMSWEDERVLVEYLSRISYGNLLTGCTAAASGYFNKSLADLTVAESALLAAIPQSPGRFNPFRHLDGIRPRQQRILQAMHRHGWLSDEQLRIALLQPIVIQKYTGGFAAPHAVEMLRGQMPGVSGKALRTTLEAGLQRQVESIITARLAALRDRHVSHAAAVVIENRTGHLLALAGSRDFFAKDGGQINGAWAAHSPGSAIKPFTYQLAFERGATPADIVADLPVEYPTASGLYRPENYARKLYGPVTYRDALGNSLNISAVKVLASLGGAEALMLRLQDLGISTLTEPVEHYGLGLTLGNAPVRLIELANAYATLARLGRWLPWRLLPDATGQGSVPSPKMQPNEAYLIADILSDNQARVMTFGTHSPLRLPFRVAVKTGTSQSYRDNWTLGYTPEFTVGVWAGNFDNTPMQGVSGVTGAAPIWRDIFMYLNERHDLGWYDEPANLVRVRIDPRTGKRLSAQSPAVRFSREDLFLAGTLPAAAIVADYDARGRAYLSKDFAGWIRSQDNWMGDVVALRESADHMAWHITSPLPGTVIHLDADLPDQGRRLILDARANGPVEWRCDTLSVQRDGEICFVRLTPGRHHITARNADLGEDQKTFVIVHSD